MGLLVIFACGFFSKFAFGKEYNGVRLAGDVVLGGLFPVHEKSEKEGEDCSDKLYNRGLQRLEAMLFAVDRINDDPNLLSNLKLGVNILDTCSGATYALNQSLEFIRSSLNTLDVTSQFQCDSGEKPRYKFNNTGPILGVIGGSYSTVSEQVANLLRLFRIPQISPASTAKALSDKTRFEMFARTVPPDNFQALALVDIVQLFNWTYVSTIASEGSYGQSGIEVFQQLASKKNICIAVQEKVPSRADDEKFKSIITNLLVKPQAKVVVLFTRADDARGLLKAAQALNHTDTFYWIASDGWGKQSQVVANLGKVACGAITVELESKTIPEFDEYMFNLTPDLNTRNPWFRDFWQSLHNCYQRNSTTDISNVRDMEYCDQDVSMRTSSYEQDSKVQFVIDAVYAYAIALDNMKKEKCPWSRGMCPAMKEVDGWQFYKDYLLKVNFTDMAKSRVQFDSKGDGLARYTIYNYQKTEGENQYQYKVIGKWFSALEMNASDVVWNAERSRKDGVLSNTSDASEDLLLEDFNTFVPKSRCSEPCDIGAVKKMTEGETCCWVCNTCQKWEYMLDQYNCEDCGQGRWPHPNKTDCYDIEVKYIMWNTIFAIVPVCLSSFGLILTITFIIIIVKHRDTPLVRASGRELSYMLLCGILLCYLNTFILLAKPSVVSCTLQRFGVGMGFSVVYGALLTKTNRIFRIFQSASQTAARPNFISPHSQLFITTSIISVQFVAEVIWCLVHAPGIKHNFPTRKQVILKCNIDDSAFVVSQVYNMLLITICTIYAIKTRKVPENFNEAKFIGFTMYTTCIIWLAFIPLYFGTGNSNEIQITTLCVTISLSAYVTLFCLYAPKIYIIVFQPEKNVRKLTMSTASYHKTALAKAMPYVNNSLANNASAHGGKPATNNNSVKNMTVSIANPRDKNPTKTVISTCDVTSASDDVTSGFSAPSTSLPPSSTKGSPNPINKLNNSKYDALENNCVTACEASENKCVVAIDASEMKGLHPMKTGVIRHSGGSVSSDQSSNSSSLVPHPVILMQNCGQGRQMMGVEGSQGGLIVRPHPLNNHKQAMRIVASSPDLSVSLKMVYSSDDTKTSYLSEEHLHDHHLRHLDDYHHHRHNDVNYQMEDSPKHILTMVTSNLETVPVEMCQDIPEFSL